MQVPISSLGKCSAILKAQLCELSCTLKCLFHRCFLSNHNVCVSRGLSAKAVSVVQLFNVSKLCKTCIDVVYLQSSPSITSASGIRCFYCRVHFLTTEKYLFILFLVLLKYSCVCCHLTNNVAYNQMARGPIRLYGVVAITFACDVTRYHRYFVIFYYAEVNQSM